MRLLKSGEMRNRVMVMAEKMKVDLRRVYVVAQGKGHLLNAFAGLDGISLTDTLSQRLNRAEVDCTIAQTSGFRVRVTSKAFPPREKLSLWAMPPWRSTLRISSRV